MSKPLHYTIWEMCLPELAEKICKDVSFLTKRCADAFLQRCIDESVNRPNEALSILVKASDYINKCKRTLYPNYLNYKIRTYGIVGSGFAVCGSYDLAMQMFERAKSIRGRVDPCETAAIDLRIALMEISRGDWKEALENVNRALPVFRQDSGRQRDDRSLATALVTRGSVRYLAYQEGDVESLSDSFRDFRDALSISHKKMRFTRLGAVNGMAAVAMQSWLCGETTLSEASPAKVLRLMGNLRKKLRHERVSKNSLIVSMCRWILGLGHFVTFGGLTRCSLGHIQAARKAFCEMENSVQIVRITLDYQWCLINEGRWSAALHEWSYIEARIGKVPKGWRLMLHMWHETLKRRSLEEEIARNVFREIRGVRNLLILRKHDDDPNPIGF